MKKKPFFSLAKWAFTIKVTDIHIQVLLWTLNKSIADHEWMNENNTGPIYIHSTPNHLLKVPLQVKIRVLLVVINKLLAEFWIDIWQHIFVVLAQHFVSSIHA